MKSIVLKSTGRRFSVSYDSYPESPRDCFDAAFIFAAPEYKQASGADMYLPAYTLKQELSAAHKSRRPIFPVYRRIRSESLLSLTPFNGFWDNDICGYLIGKQELAGGNVENARNLAEGELKTLNQWLSGDVYAARIEHANGFEAVCDDCIASIYADDSEEAALTALETLDLTAGEIAEIKERISELEA